MKRIMRCDDAPFPEYRAKIEGDVKDYITFEQETSQIYPFGIPAEDILSNKDDILNNIVNALYDTHEEVSTEQIHETICEHAGISKASMPKITADDLTPGREYTADDLMEILKEKEAPFNKILADAVTRHEQMKAEKADMMQARVQHGR